MLTKRVRYFKGYKVQGYLIIIINGHRRFVIVIFFCKQTPSQKKKKIGGFFSRINNEMLDQAKGNFMTCTKNFFVGILGKTIFFIWECR